MVSMGSLDCQEFQEQTGRLVDQVLVPSPKKNPGCSPLPFYPEKGMVFCHLVVVCQSFVPSWDDGVNFWCPRGVIMRFMGLDCWID
jgi:hypothetical protein